MKNPLVSPRAALVALLLSGCAREGDENLGLQDTHPLAAVDTKRITRPEVFTQVAALPPAEVVRRLPAHRMEAHTTWKIAPPAREGIEATATTLEEEALIETDGKGDLHVLHNNDHGYGSEAVVFGGLLYLRVRYGPFIRRKPEGDEVARLLAAAGDGSGALLELLHPWLTLSEAVEVKVSGRPAIKLTLGKRPSPERHRTRGPVLPGRLWREAAQVQSLAGTAVVDAQTGVLLGLRLAAAFQAPRGAAEAGKAPPQVQVEVSHRATVSAVGDPIEVEPPRETSKEWPRPWIDPPIRSRPMLDYQELLDGLVQRPHSRP